MVASGLIDDSQSIHSVAINGYYGNPAFEMDYTINLPNDMTLNDIRNYMMTIDNSSTSANIVPAQDPNWNDTDFYGDIKMSIGTASPFASFYESYHSETPIDSDSDGDYDYLLTKVKFTTTTSGTYEITGKLYTSEGILITSDSYTGSYTSVSYTHLRAHET